MPDFAIGQRVRLSALGREHLRYHTPTDRGEVDEVTRHGAHTYVRVRRDGLKTSREYPASFWEIDEQKEHV